MKKTFIYERVGKCAAEIFQEKAQFSKADLLKATQDSVDKNLTMEMIVALFEHHNILAQIPESKDGQTQQVYFMPCVLKSASTSELQNVRSSDEVAPLIFRYKCGYLPLGVFSSLIIGLVSSKCDNWTLVEGTLRRNLIEFLVGSDYDRVTLICQPTCIKVALYRESQPQVETPVLCANIREKLTTELEKVNSQFRYPVSSFEYGFDCKHNEGVKHHFCVHREKSSNKMICLMDRKNPIIVPMTSCHSIWLQKVFHQYSLEMWS